MRNPRPPFPTDEVGAYLHHVSKNYDSLLDGTFFLHGSLRGGDGALPTPLELARRTMDWTYANNLAPQTFFGTTDSGVQRLDPLPGHLGIDKDLLKTRRAGNYAKGEFYASRVSIRRRTRAFYAQALETVREDAVRRPLRELLRRRAAHVLRRRGGGRSCRNRSLTSTPASGHVRSATLRPPRGAFIRDVCAMAWIDAHSTPAQVPRRYRGSSRIEGYWNVFFCEACPRIPFSVEGVVDRLDAENKGSYAMFGLRHPGRDSTPSSRRRLAARPRATILDRGRSILKPEIAPHPFVPIKHDPDGSQRAFLPLSVPSDSLPARKKRAGARASARAYDRARQELKMIELEAQPKRRRRKKILGAL